MPGKIAHEVRVFGSSLLCFLELFIFTKQLFGPVLGEGVVYDCLISNDMATASTMRQQGLVSVNRYTSKTVPQAQVDT